MNDKEWQLVPREPTAEMHAAAMEVYNRTIWTVGSVYAAMLAAAPKPPMPEKLND